jgi:hypothetical protein
VAHPQIATFARVAKENSKPSRVIAGQNTMLSRTMHDIRYDEVHDELFVTNPFAQSIVAFKGTANGEEKPLRIIQGPRTMMMTPDRLEVDPVHNEIFIPDANGILVFPRDANGDVAPIRRLYSDNWSTSGVAVDPIHNVLVASGDYGKGANRQSALLIFNRTDNGNVEPKAVIAGPRASGGNDFASNFSIYAPKGWIVVPAAAELGQGEVEPRSAFIGVWSINDKGDVPPRWKIEGPKSQMKRPRGLIINPKGREVIIADMRLNAVLTYSFPEMFR